MSNKIRLTALFVNVSRYDFVPEGQSSSISGAKLTLLETNKQLNLDNFLGTKVQVIKMPYEKFNDFQALDFLQVLVLELDVSLDGTVELISFEKQK